MVKTSPTEYNPQLAHMLAAMYVSVFDEGEMKKTFKSFGFSSFETDLTDNALALGYGMAKKQLPNGRTLVLVVGRGTQGAEEWISNLTIGNGYAMEGMHEGFFLAARLLYSKILRFAGTTDVSNIDFVITGFSRAAAVANILARDLGNEENSNIYAYTFACPDVSRNVNSETVFSDYLFNISNVNDMVSWVPGMIWSSDGWDKFGCSYWYSKNWNDYQNLKANPSTTLDVHNKRIYLQYMREEKPLSEYVVRPVAESALDDAKQWRDREFWRNVSQLRQQILICAKVHCPVDVEIYGSDGQLAGRIKNNLDFDVNQEKLYVYISGDEKDIYFLDDDTYTFSLTGTDEGVMEYSVQRIRVEDRSVVEEKTFANVALTDGKQMKSTVGAGGSAADGASGITGTKLFVLDSEGTAEKEVLPDGSGTEVLIAPIPDTEAADEQKQPPVQTENKGKTEAKTPDAPQAVPPKIEISGKPKAGSRRFTVKWSAAPSAAGYQIQYSTSKGFAAKTAKIKTVAKGTAASLTVKKLKTNQKYYIRIRTYITANGTNQYSAWSKAKTVKVK